MLFRSQKEGVSYVFFSQDEIRKLRSILKYTRSKVVELEFNESDELVEAQKPKLV